MIKRRINFVTSRLLDLQYYYRVNEYNIETISRFKVWRIFKHEDRKIKQIYLHNIIDRWTKNQVQLSVKFLSRLKKMIHKFKLQLNDLEVHNLNLVEERIFSTIRHIKVLNVNFKLHDKELTYVKFLNGEVYVLKNQHLKLALQGDLFMTNKRFIIYNHQKNQILTTTYRQLLDIKFHIYGLTFINNKNQQIVFRIHDQITLNQTFINLLQKRVKWLSRKLNLKKSVIFTKKRKKHDY